MPLFEFVCDDCEEPFEKLVRSSARGSDIVCPSCGSNHVHKKLSTFASHGSSSAAAPATGAACLPGGT